MVPACDQCDVLTIMPLLICFVSLAHLKQVVNKVIDIDLIFNNIQERKTEIK